MISLDKDLLNSTYTQALSSVIFISLAPVLILLILPVDSKLNLKKLLALAAGCLLGDAFLHLIPESSHISNESHHDHDHHDHGHDHHHDHNHDHGHNHVHDHTVGLKVLAGIMVFFMLEKYIYAINMSSSSDNKVSKAKKKKNDDHHEGEGEHHHGHIHASGILNLIADFLHNFTDGLAIGASFISGTKLGLSTTFAIFLHEIPHEIGDYAILVKSGFSKTKAIWLQTLTAVGAVSGTILSLVVGSTNEKANQWILPFTAGGFIYIATVHLIPQLKYSDFKQTVLELIFFALGVLLMYMISWIE